MRFARNEEGLWLPERRLRVLREIAALRRHGISGGAGAYPDVPDYRMAYDRDGSAGVRIDASGANTPIDLTSAELQEINDEDTGSVAQGATGFGTARFAILFPELRDLGAYFVRKTANATPEKLEKSANTTNGIDGTWTTVINPWINAAGVSPDYRSSIQTVAATGIKAVRFTTTGDTFTLQVLHLYGKIASGQTTYLKVWHPTLDQEIGAAAFDWGDTPRGSSADKTFRIKNTHGTLAANSITLSLEALSDTTPSVPGNFTLSNEDPPVTFAATINIGNLAPGAISGVKTVRRNTPSNAVLSVWTVRMLAIAGSWA